MFKTTHPPFCDILRMPGNKKQYEPFFALRFLLCCAMGIYFLYFVPLNTPIQSMLNLLALLAGWCLEFTGLPVCVIGHRVLLPGTFGIDIAFECSGLPHLIVILSGVLCYPTTINSRLVGIVLITAIILVGNLLRIISLFLIGVFAREYFDITHTYIWRGISIAGIILLWLIWLHLVAIPNRNKPNIGNKNTKNSSSKKIRTGRMEQH